MNGRISCKPLFLIEILHDLVSAKFKVSMPLAHVHSGESGDDESVALIVSYKIATLCQSFVINQKQYGRLPWKSTCNFVTICL